MAADMEWYTVGRLVAADVSAAAAAASPFVAIPNSAACEAQNTKNN